LVPVFFQLVTTLKFAFGLDSAVFKLVIDSVIDSSILRDLAAFNRPGEVVDVIFTVDLPLTE
jgi:hypothetical protein